MGVQQQILPGGQTLTFSDSGIVSSTGQTISFIHDSQGRLTAVIAPDGTQVNYTYDAGGNLTSARNVTLGQSNRYGYASPHLLDMVVQPGGPDTAIQYSPGPTLLPLTADLGVTSQFVAGPEAGTLAAGGTDRYAFMLTPAELRGTTPGSVFVGIQVQAATGSNLQPAVPQIPGLTPRVTSTGAHTAFALFNINQAGLEQLDIAGLNAATSGAYSLQLFIAGDVNGDGTVDGNDAQLLTPILGSVAGQPTYLLGADANRDGVINSTDAALLSANLGFAANKPPVLTAGQVLTHQDLSISVDLSKFATDPQDEPLYYRLVGAQHGQASLAPDGHTVVFVPAAGYSGPASFQFLADDGFGTSPTGTVAVTVSTAPLVGLDFANRNPRLQLGAVQTINFVGDFADAAGVPLPASYVSLQSSNTAVFTVSTTGQITAVARGTGVLFATSHGLQAATAVAVGVPSDPQGALLYGQGLTTSLSAETLAAHVGSHQLDVSLNQTNLTPGSTGTRYFTSNPLVVQVSADGVVTAGNDGTATITVINGPAEKVVPIIVQDPVIGPTSLGAQGGVVEGTDGSMVMIAPGSLTGNATVSVAPVSQASLPMPSPSIVQFLGAINLNFGGQTLAHPVQLVVPAPAGTKVGAKVFFYRSTTIPDANGKLQPTWAESEVGTVMADGFVHTTSKNAIVIPGTYTYGEGDDFGEVDGSVAFGADFSGGSMALLGPGMSVFFPPLLPFSIDVPERTPSLTLEAIPPVGLPTFTPFTVSVGPGANTIHPSANLPAVSHVKPEVSSISVDLSKPQQPLLTVTGKNFGSNSDNDVVYFQVGGPDTVDSMGNPVAVGGKDIQAQATVISDTQLQLTVPNTVAVGSAQIFVIRDVANSGKDIRKSNTVVFPLTSGYSYVTQRFTNQVAVFDNRPAIPDPANPGSTVANPELNQTIAEIPVSGGFPQYLAVTPDNTLAYVTTLNGIAVIDTITMQQVDNITLPGTNPIPFQIVIDHAGGFAYITDWVSATVYIVDVDPTSDNFDKCVGTVQNVSPVLHGLRRPRSHQ